MRTSVLAAMLASAVAIPVIAPACETEAHGVEIDVSDGASTIVVHSSVQGSTRAAIGENARAHQGVSVIRILRDRKESAGDKPDGDTD